ncbi:MAG: hypothetical protein AB7L09_02935 [Nitrospira sp.]
MSSSKTASITCPKCGLVSRLPGDIEFRYCGTCGYHDTPDGTPNGIPGVSAKFRQPTPAMQLGVELMSLDGELAIWEEGMTSDERLASHVKRFLADVREVLKIMESTGRSDSW